MEELLETRRVRWFGNDVSNILAPVTTAAPRQVVGRIMKRKVIQLSERYTSALQKHLQEGRRVTLQAAQDLGRETLALQLRILDLAEIHEQALTALKSGDSGAPGERAKAFFREAVLPLRGLDEAVSSRSMKRGGIVQREEEADFKRHGKHFSKLLQESHRLQDHLRLLTHQALSTQEAGRKSISYGLREKIAQTLLGINVRLLNLKKTAKGDKANLKKEISKIQQLVGESVQLIERFARELDRHLQVPGERSFL
jgi:hypothetical protein